MYNFKDFLNERKNTFEIMDTKNMSVKEAEKAISAHYHDKLTYSGTEFFNKIYMDEILEKADAELEVSSTDSGQESYLGYIPSTDTFVSGWDTWDQEEGIDGPIGNIAYIKIKNKKAVVLSTSGSGGNMMYPTAYKNLKRKHKDLVDIRLD